MTTFEEGSNFISIVDENGKVISFACFEDGRHEICFEEAGFRNGVAADANKWKEFFEKCFTLMNKF